MMRSYSAGVAFAERQRLRPTQSWWNLCQAFARQCVGADAWAPSARQAFNAIPRQHRHSGTPPPGSLAYFGLADKGFGHVVYVTDRGDCYSNDILRRGRIDRVPWDVFPAAWGLPYRGWTDWTPSGDIQLRRAAKPSAHLLHLLHLAHLEVLPGRQPGERRLTDHERHVVHVWNTQGVEIP